MLLGTAQDSHPQALQLRLCPGSLDDLPHLPLPAAVRHQCPGLTPLPPSGCYSSPHVPLPGWLCLQPPRVRPCTRMCCPATSSRSLPSELSPQIPLSISLLTPHQLLQADSCLPSPTSSSLSSSLPLLLDTTCFHSRKPQYLFRCFLYL